MRRGNKRLENILTTGFGEQTADTGRRLYAKDGSPNIVKKGLPFFDKFSWYHTMLSMPSWKFWLWLCLGFLLINLGFLVLYYLVGTDGLLGMEAHSGWREFTELYFFSAQTLTTVGYGRVNPESTEAGLVAAFEGFTGLLSFALASGLFYGRFSRPQAFVKFSEKALISPYKGGAALMFRMAPYKRHPLMDAEIKLTAVLRVNENGISKNRFYDMAVEFSHLNALLMNWTIVHPLDETSPLAGMNLQQMEEAELEVMVFLKAYDEGFASAVVARTSYMAEEIVENARFVPMYHPSSSGEATVLMLDKLNEFTKATIEGWPPRSRG